MNTANDAVRYVLAEIDDDFRRLNSARAWAVHHEQNAAEYGRRVQVALSFLEDMSCECGVAEFTFGLVPYTCARHELELILKGDK